MVAGIGVCAKLELGRGGSAEQGVRDKTHALLRSAANSKGRVGARNHNRAGDHDHSPYSVRRRPHSVRLRACRRPECSQIPLQPHPPCSMTKAVPVQSAPQRAAWALSAPDMRASPQPSSAVDQGRSRR